VNLLITMSTKLQEIIDPSVETQSDQRGWSWPLTEVSSRVSLGQHQGTWGSDGFGTCLAVNSSAGVLSAYPIGLDSEYSLYSILATMPVDSMDRKCLASSMPLEY
jgi:hypothetical protein